MKYKLTFLRDNTLINDNVLQTSYETKVVKLISCLSTCVFPDKVEYPLNENKIHLGPPHESNFGYAHAKRMVDVSNQYVPDSSRPDFSANLRILVHIVKSSAVTSNLPSRPTFLVHMIISGSALIHTRLHVSQYLRSHLD